SQPAEPLGRGPASGAADGQTGSQSGGAEQQEEPTGIEHQPHGVMQSLAGEVSGSAQLLGAEQNAKYCQDGSQHPAVTVSNQGATQPEQSRITRHARTLLALAALNELWPPLLLRRVILQESRTGRATDLTSGDRPA
ncbi:MAG TPA: hypothetical protein VFO47_09805, partial [Actinomycetes bacterium]|nr:hypothetical protein [Actinomycetes bacterium]